MYTYKHPLHEEPHFGVFNKDQKKFVVTTEQDVRYIDIKTSEEIDLHAQEGLGSLQNVVADDHYFYILANKKEGKLGFYLYKLDFNKPFSARDR